MAEEKIAVLGGAGMLGTDLARQCSQQGVDFEIFDLPDFDITSEQHIRKVIENTDVIVNCAAYTDVEKAESQSQLAYKVNAEAVGRLGALAKEADKWVLHLSTDFVFDGKSDRPYVETDPTNPLNTYGASKLAGERLLIESHCPHCIMRLEWTYGLAGNNFITKLIFLAAKGKQLRVVDDQIGSPTATTEAAKAISTLVRKKPQGIFHFASAGCVSRFEMAKFIFEKLAMSVDLISCKTADFPAAAKRPLNSRFDCSKISSLLDEPIGPWQIALENFLKQVSLSAEEPKQL